MKKFYIYNENKIEFDIVYRKRKTMCIQIDRKGNIEVIAPSFLEEDYIMKKIKNKSDWIIKKISEVKLNYIENEKREIKTGSKFLFLGSEYPLDIVYSHARSIDVKFKNIDGQKVILVISNTKDKEKIKKYIKLWYKTEGLEIIKKRIDYFSKYFTQSVKEVKVKEQKSIWASCTHDNRILFNWRVVMAPIDIVDYVIIHEMCHMEYKNHSKDFWNRVKAIMPDYKKKHEYLKEKGYTLAIE